MACNRNYMAVNYRALAISLAFNAFAIGISGEHKTKYRPTASGENISVYKFVNRRGGLQTLFQATSKVTGLPVFETVPALVLRWKVSLKGLPLEADCCCEAENATTAAGSHSDWDRMLTNRTDSVHTAQPFHHMLDYSETGDKTTAAYSHSDRRRELTNRANGIHTTQPFHQIVRTPSVNMRSRTGTDSVFTLKPVGATSRARDFSEDSAIEPVKETLYMLRLENCTGSSPPVFTATDGSIVLDKSPVLALPIQHDPLFCTWTVAAPAGHYITVTFHRLGIDMDSPLLYGWLNIEHSESTLRLGWFRDANHPPVHSLSNTLHFRLMSQLSFPELHISYRTTTKPMYPKMAMELLSDNAGYITSPGYDGVTWLYTHLITDYTLTVPPNSVVMVSVAHFRVSNYDMCEEENFLRVFTLHGNSKSMVKAYCWRADIQPSIYNTTLYFLFQIADSIGGYLGFKLLFSFHPEDNIPRRSNAGMFVCDTPVYNTFRHHVACNHVPECEHSEDERNCPASADGSCGTDTVQLGKKCYLYLR